MTCYRLGIKCDAGHNVPVTDIGVQADGTLYLGGYCLLCGEQIGVNFQMTQLIASSAVRDAESNKAEVDLAHMDIKGRPC